MFLLPPLHPPPSHPRLIVHVESGPSSITAERHSYLFDAISSSPAAADCCDISGVSGLSGNNTFVKSNFMLKCFYSCNLSQLSLNLSPACHCIPPPFFSRVDTLGKGVGGGGCFDFIITPKRSDGIINSCTSWSRTPWS